MASDPTNIYYSCAILIPSSFIICGSVRTCRHWGDGKDGRKILSKYHTIKGMLILTMALLSFFNLLNLLTEFEIWTEDQMTLRISYYTFYMISWFMSFFLLQFEYRRRLALRWVGQKGFWILSFFNSVISVVLNLIRLNELLYAQLYLRIGIISIMLVCTMLLSIMAICKPNDYPITSNEFYQKLDSRLLKITPHFSYSRVVALESDRSNVPHDVFDIKLKIRDYKTKLKNDRSVVYYNIYVTIEAKTQMIRRNYSEFDQLHKKIIERLGNTDIPIPDFPLFTSAAVSIEHRMKSLSEYLSLLCKPEFMIEEFLNFLNVSSDKIKNIITERSKMVELDSPSSSITLLEDDRIRHTSYLYNYYNPRLQTVYKQSEEIPKDTPKYQSFFVVSIDKNSSVAKMAKIFISNLLDNTAFSIERSISEIHNLHKNISKQVNPAKIPKFPTSSVFDILKNKQDNSDLADRYRRLEYYLACICNDFAYLNQDLLNFLNISKDLGEVWTKRPRNLSYTLHTPITWESDIDEEGNHYIVYAITLTKIQGNNKTSWNILRRYKQFDKLHKKLINRNQSPYLLEYVKTIWGKPSDDVLYLPKLPSKTLTAISSHREIEFRRRDLEKYLQELIHIPQVQDSYHFRQFLDDKEL